MKRKCDNCQREATVHLTEIVENQKIEKHLCEVCAAKEGITIQAHVPISQLLEDFVSQGEQGPQQLGELVCEHCGVSFLEFRQSGLLGCPNDYTAFSDALTPLLERAHEGASHHVGKVPARAGGDERRQAELLRMRSLLSEAVANEQYERAAEIRDQIRELETP